MRSELYQQLNSRNGFVSGEALSAQLGVTRAALWKHIKAMQADGAEIESATGMGYKLISPPDLPRAEYLAAHVQPGIAIHYADSVTSTNDDAKRTAQQDDSATGVFIAGEQTAGKGRKGRTWQSAPDQGVYMSFLLRPKIDPALLSGLTLAAAVSLCNAIEQVSGQSVGIKWPNDIVIDGKKAAGILTESMLDMDGVEYIVCGIGLNTGTARFAGELKDTATSLGQHQPVNRMLLAAAVIDAVVRGYETFLRDGIAAFMPEFRKRSVLSGNVRIILPASEEAGTLAGFDDTGAIIIEQNGETKRFVAGEVSLRGENGYV